MATASDNIEDRMSQAFQGSPNSHFFAEADTGGRQAKVRIGNAMSVSLITHIVVFVLAIVIVTQMPESARPAPNSMFDMPNIIWTAQAGPGGGGGGGGNKMPEPPKKAELTGKDKVTVPVTKPPKLENPEPPKDVPKPEQQLTIPAVNVAAGIQEVPGALSGLPATPSQGSGSGGGAGTGTGVGMGPGQGSGLGPGYGGGTGGGVFRPGNGVVSPRLLFEKKPSYTADAMRAKIQGVVTLEAVVMPDGTVGNVQVTRSLDPTFGLDQEAIKTVKQWRFAPGTRMGQPVPVLVEIEMTFTLR
jgi:protein TonB